MQVGREFLEQCQIAELTKFGEGLKIHHETAKPVGSKKLFNLLAEKRARSGTVQEGGDITYPIGSVEIVDHGEDIHVGVFRLEERHDAVVDGVDSVALYHIEKLVGLIVHGLQSSVGGQYVEPVGIEQVDLVSEVAQGRKTGGIPRDVEGGSNALLLVELDL